MSKEPEQPEQPVVTCNWCDHRTDEQPGHVVTPEGVVETCPFIDVTFIKGL